MSAAAGAVVVVLDEQSGIAVDADRWRRLAEGALRSCGVHHGELNLLFVEEQAIAALNRDHLGEHRPTDVLSFPLDAPRATDADAVAVDPGVADETAAAADAASANAASQFAETLLGDVVVCPARAASQAGEHAAPGRHDGSLEDEVALLIVHGVLHIVGYDHFDTRSTARMQSREQALLAAHHRP